MSHSRLSRRFCLVVAAIGLFGGAGCSNQPSTEAQNQAPNQAPAHPTKAAPGPKKATASKPAVSAAAKPRATGASKPATAKVVPASAKVTHASQVITVPKGTPITATVGQALASDKNHAGDSFAASLATPVKVDGKVVLPKGAHVTGRVVTVKKRELKVTLASVVVRGKSYDLATNSVRPPDKSQAKGKASGKASSQEKSSDKKEKKDVTTLSAKTHLTFKLAKPVTVPVKG